MKTQLIPIILILSSLLPIGYLILASGKIRLFPQDPAGFLSYTLLRFRWHILGSSFILWLAGMALLSLSPAPNPGLYYLSGLLLLVLTAKGLYMTACNMFPAVREAQFLAPEEVSVHLSPDDPVVGLEINGEARAYPIKWMEQQHIVEDVVGGKQIVITYCVPCKQANAFSTEFQGGSLRLIFSRRQEQNVMLYDAKAKRLIRQISGEIIFGPGKGNTLPIVPARIVPWVTWETSRPETKVFYREPGESPASSGNVVRERDDRFPRLFPKSGLYLNLYPLFVYKYIHRLLKMF